MLRLVCSASAIFLILVAAALSAENLEPLAKWIYPQRSDPESSDIDSLMVLMSDGRETIRGQAVGVAYRALMLNVAGAERFVPRLLIMFQDDSSTYVRQQCAAALSKSGDPTVADLLLSAAQDTTENPELRAAALFSLMEMHANLEQVAAIGISNLNSESWELRLRSIGAAGATERSEDAQKIVKALVDHFEHPNEVFRKTKVDWEMSEYDFLTRAYWSTVPTVVRIDIELLVPLMDHQNAELSEGMALMLCRDLRSLPKLVEILNSSEEGDRRIQAALALGNLGDERAVPALAKALEDEYCYAGIRVAEEAYRSLLKLGVKVEKIEQEGQKAKYRLVGED